MELIVFILSRVQRHFGGDSNEYFGFIFRSVDGYVEKISAMHLLTIAIRVDFCFSCQFLTKNDLIFLLLSILHDRLD